MSPEKLSHGSWPSGFTPKYALNIISLCVDVNCKQSGGAKLFSRPSTVLNFNDFEETVTKGFFNVVSASTMTHSRASRMHINKSSRPGMRVPIHVE